MHYHIILTKECNLNCSYCGGGSDSPPKEIQYSISDLKSFLSRDEAPAIEFYGGEPLLRIETMKKIMDAVPGRYVIQTNGLFLDRIEPQYLKKFHSILVSIDGKKDVTDRNRGEGVYDRVMRNIKLIRQNGFSGDLVARMTVPQGTDIYENVLHLAECGAFDHIHWQLGFEMFWEGAEPGLEEWIQSYNTDISLLVGWWIEEMERTHHVPGIVPFTGVMNSLLNGTQSRLRCGSGIDFFAVMPDGRISACPVSIDFDFSVVGSISDTPVSLCNRVLVGEPCISCDIFHICGGRCLFVNHAQDMLRKNGYALICSTVRHLAQELEAAAPLIRELIDSRVIEKDALYYPEFNNGCEIIP
ncbi:putative peptide-modifying radical SAM enzyme, AF0577 family [Candidatus Methanoperedens nitroreducens]|uniref:Putative peptide-modifying radical SAM enzyme, AF0577 family n=1 Tax=Candidatus Methanoperedens nitratireducens TaxID=1392998 RepID=A0A062V3G5_9EURY|nr:TIGR04084 family radical SAM/SPASM domain-containing protein [Candidatus Methanoperedens nitroreducens]KCZ71163.1 putative peptide-modifying radical SAM enzyme, AF0577 family [Candidatus Methanoperedens nitroreducens]MDJ1421459.1 TIGR04084 family radical SAM/SPASM domain-containing protein [Candidatus Methanoperedens sp.]